MTMKCFLNIVTLARAATRALSLHSVQRTNHRAKASPKEGGVKMFCHKFNPRWNDPKFLVELCETYILFQSKIFDFPCPISDLSEKTISLFRPLAHSKIYTLFQTKTAQKL